MTMYIHGLVKILHNNPSLEKILCVELRLSLLSIFYSIPFFLLYVHDIHYSVI